MEPPLTAAQPMPMTQAQRLPRQISQRAASSAPIACSSALIACSSQSAEQAELQECNGSSVYAVWLCSCDAQHGYTAPSLRCRQCNDMHIYTMCLQSRQGMRKTSGDIRSLKSGQFECRKVAWQSPRSRKPCRMRCCKPFTTRKSAGSTSERAASTPASCKFVTSCAGDSSLPWDTLTAYFGVDLQSTSKMKTF